MAGTTLPHAAAWPPRLLPAPRPMMRRSPNGSRPNWASHAGLFRYRRRKLPDPALWRKSAPAGGPLRQPGTRARAWPLPGRSRARNSPTTISTTPTRHLSCLAEFGAGRGCLRHCKACQSLRCCYRLTLLEAYRKALACDPVSAFGGIIAFNRSLDGRYRPGNRTAFHRSDRCSRRR